MTNGKVGRPSKYDPDYCYKIVDMMRQGMSIIEASVRLNVHPDTVYEWAKVHPEFADAMEMGRRVSQAWWEEKARMNIESKEFNSKLWEYNVRCRFRKDWGVNQQHDINLTVNSAEAIEKAEMRIEEAKKKAKSQRDKKITIDEIMADVTATTTSEADV